MRFGRPRGDRPACDERLGHQLTAAFMEAAEVMEVPPRSFDKRSVRRTGRSSRTSRRRAFGADAEPDRPSGFPQQPATTTPPAASGPSRTRALLFASIILVVASVGSAVALVRSANQGDPTRSGTAGAAGEATADDIIGVGVESGLDEAGEPVRGGKIVYGLEAESLGGFCLPDGQLAISGIMVARAVYESLAVPNDRGEYVPWLAETIEPNAAYDEWTIKLREGISFHDGTSLDSTVVKNNLDALRGLYPGRAAPLASAVYSNVESVEVVDPLTVRVLTHEPWVAFPAFLWASGRYGMMAQAQLDDPDNCNKELIGTGPFTFDEWRPNQYLRTSRNEDYWVEAPDGEPYPYLDELEFRPIIEGEQRVNALESGEVQVVHTSSSRQTLRLRELAERGEVNMVESTRFAEVGYVMFNAGKPPFDDVRLRRAMQMGFDRDGLTQTLGEGLPVPADGPYADGVLGHLDDTGWPGYDPDEARRLVDEYTKEKGLDELKITLSATTDPEIVEIAETIQQEAKDINIAVEIDPLEQSQLINNAIGGTYEAMLFRNHPGGDPDTQYVWWKSTIRDVTGAQIPNFVNFGRINDPEIDRLLDAGRVEIDPVKRKEIYEDLNRRFADQGWNAWLAFTRWVVAADKSVHGIYGPDLPDGSAPNPGLATGHSVMGMWTTAGN